MSNDSRMNGHDPPIDREKVITLLDRQVPDLKEQLETANTEKAELLEFADRLQRQNEVLMLPSSTEKTNSLQWLLGISTS